MRCVTTNVLAAVYFQSMFLAFTKQTGACDAPLHGQHFIRGFPVATKYLLFTNPLARATRDYECADRRTASFNDFGDCNLVGACAKLPHTCIRPRLHAQGFAIVRSRALHAHGHYSPEPQLMDDTACSKVQTSHGYKAVYALRTYLHGLPLFRAFLFQQICYACDACVCGLPLFRAFLF
jgi:hypothetical protein